MRAESLASYIFGCNDFLRPILFNECLTTKLFCILTDGRFLLKFLSSLIIKLSQERSCISVNSRNLSESFRGSLRKKVFSSRSEIFREERILTREEEKIGLVDFLNQPKQWQQNTFGTSGQHELHFFTSKALKSLKRTS